MIQRIFHAGLALCGLCCVRIAAEDAKPSEPDNVRLVSPNLGLMFFGEEPVKVGLRLQGPLSKGTLEYTVEQRGTDWKTQGSLRFERVKRGETRTEPLVVPSLGPGLYRVRISGVLGSKKISFERNLSVLSPPPPAEANSPWGAIYCPPDWYDAKNPKGGEEGARSLRLLGTSWVRLGFWEGSFGPVTVTPPDAAGHRSVKSGNPVWKSYASELHKQGMHIMGTLGNVPRALSSQPDKVTLAGDSGPEYGRVRPADYGLWEEFIQQVSHDFKEEIEAWEIGNEPENHGVYFYGTIEEFSEFVHHTSVALRRENPTTKIAGSGFTRDRVALNWGRRLLELGMAHDIDYFSVHYTDNEAVFIDRWKEILREKQVTMPIWNSEENSAVPIFDRMHGIALTFKFLHVNTGYEDAGNLVEKDYTLRLPGMEFAMGTRCLGSASYLRTLLVAGGTLHLFQREREVVGVYQREMLSNYLNEGNPPELRLKGVPLNADRGPTVTTSFGRVLRPASGENGEFKIEGREPLVFINGCASLEPVASNRSAGYVVGEAEDGIFSSSWQAIDHRNASHQRELELWTEDDGGKDGHRVEIKLNVPVDGSYSVLFSGSPLSALKSPRWINPFSWSVGEQAPVKVDAPLAVVPGSEEIEGGLSLLGKVNLKAGPQIFRLWVTDKTEANPKYRFVFDAIVLRPVGLQ